MATNTEKYTAFAVTVATTLAGLNLIKGNKAAAQTNGALPADVVALLQLMAEAQGVTVEQLNDILTAINNLTIGGGSVTVKGYPENCDYVAIAVVNCQVAGVSYPVPAYIVPEGFQAKIKAHPANVFGSLLYWSTSPAPNANSSEPLMPNDFALASLKTTEGVYVFSNVAGSMAVITVEQRRAQ
jgi:hypothetical protein